MSAIRFSMLFSGTGKSEFELLPLLGNAKPALLDLLPSLAVIE